MNKNINNKFHQSAFTIVELLIVIVIIGILAAITIVSYTGITKKANESTLQADLATAKKQFLLYFADHGVYPTSLEDGTNCLKGTTLPSPDTRYCLKSTSSSAYTLTDATGNDYTLTLTKGSVAFKITKDTSPASTIAAAPGTSFVKVWGGAAIDVGYDIIKTSDNGYAITGYTYNYSAGNNDMFIAKYDVSGNLSWNKIWGGTSYDEGRRIAQTNDGGYVVTGYESSYGGGGQDMFIVKYDASGNLIWNKTWGGSGSDLGFGIAKTSDGGCIVTGQTGSYGSGGDDSFIAKYDTSGNLSWTKTWGSSSEYEIGNSITQTSDGGYAVAGYASGFGAGNWDVFLAKYDASGNLSWNKTWGGASIEYTQNLIQTSDGGYAVTGYTNSFGAGGNDVFFIKFDSSGNFSWNRNWGGTGDDRGQHIIQTSDGGYAVAGQTSSYGAGASDALLIKYDTSGNLSWNKTLGGINSELGFGVTQTSDDGFAITGHTNSYGAGNHDMLLMKYKSDGSINNCSSPMCQSPTATVTTPTATVTTPSATVLSPTANVTSPTAITSSPVASQTVVVVP